MAVMGRVIRQYVEQRISGDTEKEPVTVPLSIRISPGAQEQLRKYASALRVTPSTLARRLIEAGLEEVAEEISRLTAAERGTMQRKGKG